MVVFIIELNNCILGSPSWVYDYEPTTEEIVTRIYKVLNDFNEIVDGARQFKLPAFEEVKASITIRRRIVISKTK